MMPETFAQWSTLLERAKLGVTPAELHGSVTGFLCAGWGGHANELLASLALEGDARDAAASEALHAALEHAAARIAARLRAGEPVELLLPDAPLAARANAAVDWCRGFLGGIGLTGVLDTVERAPEMREWLDGLGAIAAAHLRCNDGDTAELDAVLAYIRTAVAGLQRALAPTVRT